MLLVKRNISYKLSGLLGVDFGGHDINVHSHLSNDDKNYNNIHPKMEPQATLQTLSYMISIQNILKEKKTVLRGLMWKHFTHLKIEENSEVSRDDFRFVHSKTNVDVTDELDLGKEN